MLITLVSKKTVSTLGVIALAAGSCLFMTGSVDTEAMNFRWANKNKPCSLVTDSTQALPWPKELPQEIDANGSGDFQSFVVPKSNYVQDLHGNIQDPDLVLFMAGNQYMVMPELIEGFKAWVAQNAAMYPGLEINEVFYATTPPGRLIGAMEKGELDLGSYNIKVTPDTLWPDVFMTGLRQQRRLDRNGFAENGVATLYTRDDGAGILVRAGNPKNITEARDLRKKNIRVAISDPEIEPASYETYGQVLDGTGFEGLAERVLNNPGRISPRAVHHRENPQYLADDLADAAMMYDHFGQYLTTTFPECFDYIELPDEGNRFATMAWSKMVGRQNPMAADAWTTWLTTDEAQAIYESKGYQVLPQEERDEEIDISETN